MFWYWLQSALILHNENIYIFLLGPLRWRSSCPRSICDATQWMKTIYDAARWMNTTSENIAIAQAYKWFLWFGLKHLFHGRRLAEEFHWASNSSESLRLGNITNTQCKKIGSDLEAWAVALANVLRIEHNNILHVCIDQLKSMSSIGFSFGRSKIGTLKFEPVGEGFLFPYHF